MELTISSEVTYSFIKKNSDGFEHIAPNFSFQKYFKLIWWTLSMINTGYNKYLKQINEKTLINIRVQVYRLN